MNTRHHRAEIIVTALLGALAGLFVGFVWGSGILEVLPSRHDLGNKVSAIDNLTADQYQDRMFEFAIVGTFAGAVVGAATGFYTVRRKHPPAGPQGS